MKAERSSYGLGKGHKHKILDTEWLKLHISDVGLRSWSFGKSSDEDALKIVNYNF